MAAGRDLKSKVKSLLSRRVRKHYQNGSSVRVEESDYRDYLHVYVTSPKFRGTRLGDRAAPIWKWLEQELRPSELVKITLLMTLTPAEEREFLIAGR